MTILNKSRELGRKALDSVAQGVDHVTGRALVREAEKFNGEMEAVYAALVMRFVAAEERIDRLEGRLKWANGVAIAAIILSLAAMFVKIR